MQSDIRSDEGDGRTERASTAGSSIPVRLAVLAQRLHEMDSQELEIAVPAGVVLDLANVQGVALADGMLQFAALTDRNRIVAASTFSALGEQALDPAALFKAAANLWRHEIGHEDMACARLLALVHPRSDVLAMAATQVAATSDVFGLLNILEKLLPLLDSLDWGALIALSEAQYRRTLGDGAAGAFFEHVRQWLVEHSGSGAQLTALLLRDASEPLANLLKAAWLAWGAEAPAVAAARLVELAVRVEPPFPAVTAQVTERMLQDASLPPGAVAPLEALIHQWIAGATPEARRCGIAAATEVLHLRRSFDAALRALAQTGDPDTLGFLAFSLSRHSKAFLEAGSFFDWLALCVALPTSHLGAVRFLDSTLARHLGPQSQHRDAVLSFLQTWITAQPMQDRIGREFAKLFGSCAGRIVQDQALLSRVLTTWFLADAWAMPESAAGLIVGLSSEARMHRGDVGAVPVSFDPALLDDATAADLMFLARRLIGYVISADLLLALALSLLQVRDAKARVHPLMASLLGDEIGYDYPVTTVEKLGIAINTESDPDTRMLLERIRADLQRYLEQLDALPRLREFAVPLTLQRAFRKARAKQMEIGMREARKESVFAQFVNPVHLKAGLSSFQYLHEDFTEPTVLKSISYSFEMPRRESLDPVGNAYRLHMNRHAKREPT